MTKSVGNQRPFPIYVTAGEYMKAIGTQDGHFPDFGHHVANEMGGVWLHPIKLLDGFWLRVTDTRRGIAVWTKADEFITHPWGNEFRYDHGLGHIPVSIRRVQFAPEQEKGLVVSYEICNYASEDTALELEWVARSDLRPVWFSDEIGIHDGEQDEWQQVSASACLAKDCDHDWYVMVGTDWTKPEVRFERGLIGPEWTSGNGAGVSMTTDVVLKPDERLRFQVYVAGSYASRAECEATYERLVTSHAELLAAKQRLYARIEGQAQLQIEGESRLNDIFAWTKWNNQWLVQRVDGIGRGLTAGSPHYPWWFGCDNSYALQGVAAIGDFELVRDTLKLIRDTSLETNGNGRIIHEVTTMGAVSNPGNTQETAHYIALIWDVFRWLGDKQWLAEHYALCALGMAWLLGEMDPDGDGFPSGYGIIEIAGLNMELIDSAVYTAQAAAALAAMSRVLGYEAEADRYAAKAEQLAEAINRVYWCEQEGLYADAVAPKKDVEPKADFMVAMAAKHSVEHYRDYVDKLLQAAGDDQEDRGWLLNKNWVIVTPMEAGIADREKGKLALERMRTPEFIGPYGTYLSGMYRQGTMTISTGAHAVAEAAYGNPDAALDLLERMMNTFSLALPGSMSEMSPDYGCAVQAWTIYALAVPIVKHLIGIQPDAHRNEVRIAPDLPQAWQGKRVALKRIRIGAAWLDVELRQEAGELQASVNNEQGLSVTVEWNGKAITSTERMIRVTL
ncbi:family 78 glycoside hydrolase catalytic domain [Paenibacillus thiaminolyticus]|uniref:Glycogen debranching protein n=1 Tax=Paenibacillus thiaminolyticus TaxID=49283 RepID=A0A3A3GDQ5_PANTH|nr:family 78 glycoside hydrolase catalytic domain [Paenibacillus thiaminolyticus]RJG21987.1 glycogen debranching protein [Paenibacillus thiaminolyticus]